MGSEGQRDRDPAKVLAEELADLAESARWAARKLRVHDQLRAWSGERPVPDWEAKSTKAGRPRRQR